MRFLLASNNQKKMKEMRRILEPMGIEVISPEEAGVRSEAEENGTTFRENARIKAMELYCKTGIPSVADDSGLCVDALDGRPGVYSARYGGEALPYPEKIAMLLRELADTPPEKRTARFACAICCVLSKDVLLEAEGFCEGTIGYEPVGEGGFGYDPVFLVGQESFATLSPEQKDAASHRGAALRLLKEKLMDYISS